MKHFSTFVSMFLLLLMGGVQTATAQDDSDWERYAQDPDEVVTTNSSNPKYVYLYNVTKKQFLNAGGEFGMQGILNPRGIRMTLLLLLERSYCQQCARQLSCNGR